MPLLEPFTREKNTIQIIILLQTGKKYRKIARGKINLYKKYFLTEQLAVDKWIHLQFISNSTRANGT